MPKAEDIEVTGRVIAVLPGNKFKVQLDYTDSTILCHLSGRMRKNRIKVILGDAIEATMSPYDITLGRITRRN